ncbi:glycosyl hydrolase family 18 protein [Bacillus tianshenii]|nr:glycosyl hydrolase family 18 protein [Bacillus tianshenii]
MRRLVGVVLALLMFSFTFAPIGEAATPKTGMSYLHIGTPEDHVQYVDRTDGAIQTVTPNYFDIGDDGNVKLTNRVSTSFMEAMDARNVRVVPFLSNHWNRELGRKALKNRDAFTSQLVQYVKQYDFDGINVDMEGLTEEDRDAFTSFVKLLREKMPKEKEVSVAVAANPTGSIRGWHGSYDYTKLGKHADYLMMMTYDESWDGSAPGPVASLPFVEKSVQYALSQNVPAHKLVLGLPFYGRIWHQEQTKVGYTPQPGTEKVNGRGIIMDRIDDFVQKYDGESTYVSGYDSIRTTFEITEDDPEAKLYSWSKPLPVGHYEVWHESPETLKKKIQLVHKYDLKGIGSWALGQESANVWENFDFWLSGKVFEDVELEHWAAEAIAQMKEKGWMGGRTTTLFAPEGSLKRSETATVLIRALELNMVEPYDTPFNDVKNTYWAHVPIEAARQHGLMNGRAEDKFAPEAKITREEMAVILSRIVHAEQDPAHATTAFKDVSKDRWSYGAIRLMNQAGIFGGFSDGTFRPEEPVTRAQMAALLERISHHLE